MINYVEDTKGNIESVVNDCMKKNKDFRLLRQLRFLYTYKVGDPTYSKDNIPLEAFAKKLPPRERDVYKRDVELCVHEDSWHSMKHEQKIRLVFRMLLSIQLELDENFKIIYDDDERIMFKIVPPDIIVRIFSKELEVFGLPANYKTMVRALAPKRKEA